MIRRGTFHSVTELESAIYQWLATWNHQPKPFVWRAKSEGLRSRVLSVGETSHVSMVQPTHAGHGLNLAMTCFPSLHWPHLWCVLPQSIVDPICMMIAEVFTNQSPQVGCIEHTHVIQHFPAAAPHPSFGNPILLAASIGCPDQFA